MLATTPERIEHYRLALLRLVVGLFGLAGIEPGREFAATVPRHVRSAIFKVLRQAESAARRLIFTEARALAVPAYVPRAASAVRRTVKTSDAETPRASRIPQFQLIDPRTFYAELYPHRKPRGAKRERRSGPKLLFRIFGYDGQPDYVAWSEPEPELSPDDPLNAVPLSRRMQALYHALGDLPKQAGRMAREIGKREAAKPGPGKVPPLQPGLPPGHRKRPVHPVDAILHECHCLAVRDPVPADTS